MLPNADYVKRVAMMIEDSRTLDWTLEQVCPFLDPQTGAAIFNLIMKGKNEKVKTAIFSSKAVQAWREQHHSELVQLILEKSPSAQ